MQAHYRTLKTIYDVAGTDPQPEIYPCKPREIILRLVPEWSVIQQHLNVLEAEGLISTTQQETLVIRINREGIKKLFELREAMASA